MMFLGVLMAAAWVPYFANRPEHLRFLQWSVTPDHRSCFATIDASELSSRRREKYEIALACGLVDPAADKMKDERITVSPLFVPQEAITIVAPMRQVMIDTLERDRAVALKNAEVPSGTSLMLANTIWFRIVLLPRGADVSNIHRLADVARHDGEIPKAEAAVGIARAVTKP
jgi:hypothetical protein